MKDNYSTSVVQTDLSISLQFRFSVLGPFFGTARKQGSLKGSLAKANPKEAWRKTTKATSQNEGNPNVAKSSKNKRYGRSVC